MLAVCGDYDPVTCLGTYDPTQSYYTDIEIDDSNRSWEWIVYVVTALRGDAD